jgi:arginyl-tRNA synthetase
LFHLLEKRVLDTVSRHITIRYGLTDIPVAVEQPRQTAFGELALPVAFQLAKPLRQPPRKIAEELVAELGDIEGVSKLEVAGGGYINVRFDRGAYGASLLGEAEAAPAAPDGKIIVEHTNINPNKAAHVGHVRNAILGDTFIRMMRSTGRQVEVQNYIDNTGVQVADVVVGFHFLEHKTPGDVRNLIAAGKFDYYCWDLYAKISGYYKENPDSLKWRHDTLHAIEAGEGTIAELGHLVADAIVECHLATMLRLGIEYDVLPRESEILHLKFWATAFELLKEKQAIYFETEGKNKGCWVMPGTAFSEHASEDDEDFDKIIVRSNGTVTYVGKDIAYQLWKFGLLGKDFHYRLLKTYPDGHPLFVTQDHPSGEAEPSFGRGSRVYNVIDSRQSYLQDVVVAGLRALGYKDAADASVHFAYEMVALTPATCVELGIPLSDEDRQRPYVEVSGRKGLGIKADDLLDALIARALEEVNSRHPEDPEETRRTVATQIAVGALRYFMLKFTRNSVIAFDLNEALSFEGETGPYAQYAAVRAQRILDKVGQRGITVPDFRTALNTESMGRQLAGEDFWQLLLAASRAEAAIEKAVASCEPSHVARYAFQLAQAFSTFYQDYRVLDETDEERRTFLLWMTDYFRIQLRRTLSVLGIEVPQYM